MFARIAPVIGLVLCCALALTWSSSGEAKLDPYYVMRGVGVAKSKPRVLFVVDTSGSMSWRTNAADDICDFADCEYGTGDRISRIASARKAIREVIVEAGDVADFALMAFGQAKPPTSSYDLPSTCYGQRFRWTTHYLDYYTSRPWRYTSLYGYAGVWVLCGANRPYPYLRWDNLGNGSGISQQQSVGPVPPSPLIATDYWNFAGSGNASRKVQFFPKFMGARVNLNDDTDPGRTILNGTYGDYGNTSSDRFNKVWNHDFYYWPYVDGFPGYSYHMGYSPTDGYTREMGIMTQNFSNYPGANLYSPFFLRNAGASLPAGTEGPATKEAATETVKALTGPFIEGGLDAHGGTPWATTIGTVPWSATLDNRVYSHTTVASYLKMVKTLAAEDICVPLTAVLLTDGDPMPVETEGGSILHGRLAALRRDLGVKTYIVGFVHDSTNLNDMACAAAGSSSSYYPCGGTPVQEWDTCRNPANPSSECAYLAKDGASLAKTLLDIVSADVQLNLVSGPGFAVNEFGLGSDKQYADGDALQTQITAHTEWPNWRGHVVRGTCTETDPDTGELLEHCRENHSIDADTATFGPCGPGRSWNAGECLRDMDWTQRRVYSHTEENQVYRISDHLGHATSEFLEQLNSSDLDLPGAPYNQVAADALVAFIQGAGAAWKLPSVAKSAPIVVRKIPKKNSNYSPSVGIRDPHCAGRRLSSNVSLPKSLEDYADEVWDEDNQLYDPKPHMESQEAVVIGDDLGMVHAFHLDSGNELWGLLPRTMIIKAIEASANGHTNMGQPKEGDEHIYGMGGTLNHGWVFDANAGDDGQWRHLAIMGSANGGNLYMVLDLGHMSPASPRGPVEVLWTTHDPDLADKFAARLGETWSRPALVYHVPNDNLSQEPKALLVMGSGYRTSDSADYAQGRAMLVVDALTGEILDEAILPKPSEDTYDQNFGTIVDPAVATHCSSRFWAEAQEVYFPDLAGRLFRWDIAHETDHEADSGGRWSGEAKPAAQFFACEGEGDFECDIDNDNKADPFYFGAAVMANNRIDDGKGAASGTLSKDERNQFVVALNSGSLNDGALSVAADGDEPDLHASLYVLVDDHRNELDKGFSIRTDSERAAQGERSGYFRMPVTAFERVRRYRPFEDSAWYEETRRFSRRTMPVRAPRIVVEQGYSVNDEGKMVLLPNVEFIYFEFTLFEPPAEECSKEWYDASNRQWHYDEGATYVIRGRLVAEDGKVFDFKDGAPVIGGDVTSPDRHGFTKNGLQFLPAEQQMLGDCEDGNCSAQPGTAKNRPCDLNREPSVSTRPVSVRLSSTQLTGFSPVEIPQ